MCLFVGWSFRVGVWCVVRWCGWLLGGVGSGTSDKASFLPTVISLRSISTLVHVCSACVVFNRGTIAVAVCYCFFLFSSSSMLLYCTLKMCCYILYTPFRNLSRSLKNEPVFVANRMSKNHAVSVV